MQRLSPPTTRHHGQHTIFVSKDLATCNHVFLRTDYLRKGLKPLYEGPYKVVDHTEKVFRILRHGKEVSVSIDRLKPAYILKESEDFPVEVNLKEKVSLQPEKIQELEQEKPRESSSRQEATTRSGRRLEITSVHHTLKQDECDFQWGILPHDIRSKAFYEIARKTIQKDCNIYSYSGQEWKTHFLH
ncbi:retrovirus-related Pol polyprotein from transposon 412 [Trichonephila inaurata madagascariensis]|uniref:Retrovirus-related Pol polyprotein from transposon 412 n=1 Tax=Trichonephila inaurata madagascariensis TaxID=2747483 RepID=A0A8X6YB22_9ARAC|nr:retrovirus-related Pol polyprotein from transposon 412 [Trichonephila inaurata madagascariensis]